MSTGICQVVRFRVYVVKVLATFLEFTSKSVNMTEYGRGFELMGGGGGF